MNQVGQIFVINTKMKFHKYPSERERETERERRVPGGHM